MDSLEAAAPARSALKKDPSYEAPSRPAAPDSAGSSEDLCRNFSDVIIDPLPGQGRRSAPEVMYIICIV